MNASKALNLADLATLGKLDVDVSRYRDRDYSKTQQIADAAYFLGFYGLVAPSARWHCTNAVLFTDRISPGAVEIVESDEMPIDWEAWRKRTRT